MSKNRWVNTRFWDDNYVVELDPSEKLLFLYCLTNDATALCGAYEVSLRKIAMETGFDKEMLLKIFSRFERDGKISYVGGYVVVKNYRKYQSDNDSIRAGIFREEKALPQPVLDRLSTDWVQTDPSVGTDWVQPPYTLPILNLTKPNSTLPNRPASPSGRDVFMESLKLETREAWDAWESRFSEITADFEGNRAALNKLIDLQKDQSHLDDLIRLASKAWEEKYAPKDAKASSPKQLLEKRSALLAWGKGKFSQQEKTKVVSIS